VKVAVIGAGAWGTALATVLYANRHDVTLWSRDAAALNEMRERCRNQHYLPGVELPGDWTCEADLVRAADGCKCIVMAVPSQAFRSVAVQLRDSRALFISVTKGIEYETGKSMCGVLRECVPGARAAALSGPTFAIEVARGLPAAIVGASEDSEIRGMVQELFHRPTFRVYRSSDLIGVELGGALKNVIAIAAGICEGLRLGDNAKAALVTRGIAEMRRIGVAAGAQPETFAGLSGLGDLTLTCFSQQSRNRSLGERAGRGEPIQKLTAAGEKLAEGYPTARSARQLARKLNVETPIFDEVYAMLYEGKDVRHAVSDLLSRDTKAED
jgi:glycerol-3-phosphate dehydrogenase (NAD(P)+)